MCIRDRLLIALPVHFWAWILWFQEFENFSQSHGLWDALGIGSYFLVFAMFESAAIFGLLTLLMLLLPRRLDQRKVFAVTASIYLALAGWFILEQVRFLIPTSAEVWVLGDTAFQHVPLLRWIRRRGWHFVIRQQGRITVYHTNHGWRNINTFSLDEGQTRVIGWVRVTQKYDAGWYWLVLHWAEGEDEPWYLLSDRAGEQRLIRLYQVRMWIEEMYGDMKGHGFDLEATHLEDADRIARLVLGVCITFVWFISLGSWVVKRGFRHFIDRKDRRDKSHFRLSWDWLKRCRRLNQPFKLRFCPYP